jgi:hypothetical protein
MHRVARKIKDKRVLKLIGKYLRAGAMLNGRRQVTRKDVPLTFFSFKNSSLFISGKSNPKARRAVNRSPGLQ